MPSVIKSFSFDPREYPELAAWLASLEGERGRISREVTQALVMYIHVQHDPNEFKLLDGKTECGPPAVDLRRIQAQLDRIEARLAGCTPPTTTDEAHPTSDALPDDVLAALDSLAL